MSSLDIQKFNQLTRQGAFDEAHVLLKSLIRQHPQNIELLMMSTKLSERLGDIQELKTAFKRLINHQSVSADSKFNMALKFRKLGYFDLALQAYQKCLEQNITDSEDAYLNMGVIYADILLNIPEAEKCFEKALQHNKHLISGYLNLGNLYEETGRFEEAKSLYENGISNNPNAPELLGRLGNTQTITSYDDPVFKKLEAALRNDNLSDFDQECLYFALGNALDSLKNYPKAFEAYQHANSAGLRYGRPYDAISVENYIDLIIKDSELHHSKLLKYKDNAKSSPIFICGMFRSGSTLLEQIISSHPRVTAKGELDFFANLYLQETKSLSVKFPVSLTDIKCQEAYENYYKQPALKEISTPWFTDKRPDNFLYIGLIKSIFPKSKIIFTKRDALDNALSIFFTQFGDSQAYARKLTDIAHFYKQHERLLDHWKTVYPEDTLIISYDALVTNFEQTTRDVIEFLGLDWEPSCLAFHQRKNRVKTASFKQVRQKLYTTSSMRWKNYETFLPELRHALET